MQTPIDLKLEKTRTHLHCSGRLLLCTVTLRVCHWCACATSSQRRGVRVEIPGSPGALTRTASLAGLTGPGPGPCQWPPSPRPRPSSPVQMWQR